MLNNREKLKEIVDQIMSEMFFLFPDMDDNGEPLKHGSPSADNIQVSIELDSQGYLLFKADREMLATMASNFMGILPDQIEEEHIRSMAVEAANIIGGNYLSEVDPDGDYEFTKPETIEKDVDISSADWHINFISGGEVLTIAPFDSDDISKSTK